MIKGQRKERQGQAKIVFALRTLDKPLGPQAPAAGRLFGPETILDVRFQEIAAAADRTRGKVEFEQPLP